MRILTAILFYLFLCPRTEAQHADSLWHTPAYEPYAFIKDQANTISGVSALDSFYKKLVKLKHTKKGRVSVVHIGDSHIQADKMTIELRSAFQSYFGDAGRGLVFPYQLAGTNAPNDISAHSNVSWKSGKIISPSKGGPVGISGYGIQNANKNANITMRLNDQEGRQSSFNKMVLFVCNDSFCFKLTDSALSQPLVLRTPAANPKQSFEINVDSMLRGFTLSMVEAYGNKQYAFYGVSLEKADTPGVLYHAIGINGARFDQFDANDQFFRQLSGLPADLYVVSLGTNEAQNQFISNADFLGAIDLFAQRIHHMAPGVPILFTTPPASWYHQKKPNKSVEKIAGLIKDYCFSNKLPCWDLFSISSGMQGANSWKKFGLLSHDLVHYTTPGYILQGQLLAGAFATGYNEYVVKHPYKYVATVNKPLKTQPLRKADSAKVNAPVAPPAQKAQTRINGGITFPDSTNLSRRKTNIQVQYSDK